MTKINGYDSKSLIALLKNYDKRFGDFGLWIFAWFFSSFKGKNQPTYDFLLKKSFNNLKQILTTQSNMEE